MSAVYLPNFVEIVITIVITYYLLRIGRFIARKTAEGTFTFDGFYPDWAMPTYNIVKVIVIVLAFAIIYPLLPGYNQEEFQYISSLAFGFLASLGAASVTANIAAGIVITYMRPFQVGDHVAIDDIEGDVVERTLLVTRLNTLRNEDVTVPNAKVLGDSITNFTRNANEHGIVVSARISIGYDVPWHKVRELLLDAASRSDGIDATPSPFVRQVSLEDFYIVYDVCGTTRTPQNRGAILSELHAHILDVFNAAGVEILSPHFEAGRDGKASTVIVPRSPMESDTT